MTSTTHLHTSVKLQFDLTLDNYITRLLDAVIQFGSNGIIKVFKRNNHYNHVKTDHRWYTSVCNFIIAFTVNKNASHLFSGYHSNDNTFLFNTGNNNMNTSSCKVAIWLTTSQYWIQINQLQALTSESLRFTQVQNHSTVTNLTVEPYCIILPITMLWRRTCKSQTLYYAYCTSGLYNQLFLKSYHIHFGYHPGY